MWSTEKCDESTRQVAEVVVADTIRLGHHGVIIKLRRKLLKMRNRRQKSIGRSLIFP
jgi:hypothetical protein